MVACGYLGGPNKIETMPMRLLRSRHRGGAPPPPLSETCLTPPNVSCSTPADDKTRTSVAAEASAKGAIAVAQLGPLLNSESPFVHISGEALLARLIF